MLTEPLPSLAAWLDHLNSHEMPILRHTERRLLAAKEDIDAINGRDITAIVLQDPLMAVRVLAYIQPLTAERLHSDITTIGNAIMMLGIEPFFARFSEPSTIEAMLHGQQQAMLGVLQVIRRAQRAAKYAHDWAFQRHDMNPEEVALAALLHDLSEILLWCFAPALASEIQARKKADKTLRSAVAQEQVLGIRLFDLQLALCDGWHLPALMHTLMDDENAELPRVQNVALAVNLARHSATGWEDAALDDDFSGIEKLLHIDRATLLARLEVPESLFPRYLGETPTDESPPQNSA